jgi:hypothetical protein
MRTLRATLRDFVKIKPVMISLSLIIGFGITTFLLWFVCRAYSVDLGEWIKANIQGFMLIGIGMSAFVGEMLRR